MTYRITNPLPGIWQVLVISPGSWRRLWLPVVQALAFDGRRSWLVPLTEAPVLSSEAECREAIGFHAGTWARIEVAA